MVEAIVAKIYFLGETSYDDEYDYDDNYIDTVYGSKKEFSSGVSESIKKDSASNNKAWNKFGPGQWEVVTGRPQGYTRR